MFTESFVPHTQLETIDLFGSGPPHYTNVDASRLVIRRDGAALRYFDAEFSCCRARVHEFMAVHGRSWQFMAPCCSAANLNKRVGRYGHTDRANALVDCPLCSTGRTLSPGRHGWGVDGTNLPDHLSCNITRASSQPSQRKPLD